MGLLSSFKGFIGEAVGSIVHKKLLDRSVYRELNNVTIPTPDGTTQIDHVLVSRYGIFVIESKNMGGWIFGNANSAEWTQSFPGGKFRFQNPLRQNYRHTKCLSAFLDIEHDKFHSVVMFWGDSQFKTPMPENVLDSGYTGYIKSKTEVLFTDEEVEQIVEAIKTGKLPRTWATRRKHLASLKERHSDAKQADSKSTQIQEAAAPACPLCGKEMVKRTAKRGNRQGNEFWGCSGYPACKGIVNIQPSI